MAQGFGFDRLEEFLDDFKVDVGFEEGQSDFA